MVFHHGHDYLITSPQLPDAKEKWESYGFHSLDLLSNPAFYVRGVYLTDR